MKTKQLLMAAFAMPIAFVACTNDEIVEMNNLPQLESERIVGAEMIADGATIEIVSDAESRVTNGNWDSTDRLGLAWWNNPESLGGKITDKQNTKNYQYATADDGVKIYNNYLAQYNGKSFEVYGEVYAGAYFVYYPYAKIGNGAQLSTITSKKYNPYVQTKKVEDSEKDANLVDFMTSEPLHVSHKMRLTANDVDENLQLNVHAKPTNTMNAFVIQPSVETTGDAYEAIKGFLSDIAITQVDVTVDEPVFATNADVNAYYLPETKSKPGQPIANNDLKAAFVNRSGSEQVLTVNDVKKITTQVKYENSLADEDLANIFAFTFATKKPSNDLTKATIVITTNVGTFEYTYNKEDEVGAKMLGKLNGTADNAFMNTTGIASKLEVVLDLKDLKLKPTANGPAAWNLLMKLYEATGVETIPQITVSNMTFTNDIPMYLPEGKDVTAKGDITFEGNQTIPGALTVTKKITVAEGAILTIGTEDVTAENIVVNGTLNLDAEVTATTITNNGTINVNADLTTEEFTNNADATVNIAKGIEITASTTYANAGTIDIKGTITGEVNNTGEIIVTYNEAQVAHSGAGIVRGVLDATEGTGFIAEDNQVLAIYQMIDNTNSKVKCNALELIGFNLTEGDQYQVWGSDPLIFTANKFNGIDVKLVNSTLQANEASTFYFDELELNGSTITGKVVATGNMEASNNSEVTGDIDANAITANALTVTGDVKATSGNVSLTESTVTGDVMGVQITLTSTEVEGNVEGVSVIVTGSTITGDVATDALTIDNSTVTGNLTVTGALIIKNNSTVTATTALSAGITAENSTLVGSFNAGTENVVLTNCTIQYNEVASMIKTTGDLTITSADAAAFNIYNTDINATNVTFAGKKGVVLNCSRVEATNKCNVNTKVTHKKVSGLTNESSIKAADINIAVGASLGAGIIAEEI